MSETAFSLEINERFTRMCDTKVSGKKVELVSLGYQDTTPLFFSSDSEKSIEKQAEVITSLYNNLKIKKRGINVIIPDIYTYSQIVEMPKLKEKELLAAIHYQADEFIPMPIEETSIDLEILREDPKSKKVLILIVASPKKIVNQIEKTIEMANLIPETLENELSACGRLISEVLQYKEGVALYVNFGFSHCSIYLVDTASSLIILSRTIKIGMELFVRDIKANLNWEEKKIYELLKTIGLNKNGSYDIESIVAPLVKELLQEIEKMMILARDKYGLKVDRLYMLNFDQQIAMLDQKIQAYFSLAVTPLLLKDNLVNNTIAQSFAKDMSAFVPVIAGTIR